MWMMAGGMPSGGEGDLRLVALIAALGGGALLVALAVRVLEGRRRRRAGSDYS